MKNSDPTISEIAYEVGFSHPNCLSGAFHKVFEPLPAKSLKLYIILHLALILQGDRTINAVHLSLGVNKLPLSVK